jgi:uncharacterized membrane protein
MSAMTRFQIVMCLIVLVILGLFFLVAWFASPFVSAGLFLAFLLTATILTYRYSGRREAIVRFIKTLLTGW